MSPTSSPLFLSPALPTELLWHIIHTCSFPSTLIICSSRVEFLSATARQIRQEQQHQHQHQHQHQQRASVSRARGTEHEEIAEGGQEKVAGDGPREQGKEGEEEERLEGQGQQPRPSDTTADARATQLLAAPLYQVAVSRHIRVVFVPTVSHLRALLSVFSVADSKVGAPPPSADRISASPKTPLLLIYGFLELHRSTSEWSVQGISNTAAVLVETAKRVAFQAAVIEPPSELDMDGLWTEKVPVLSGSASRIRPGFEGSGWTGRTVTVRRILGRWFRIPTGGDWQQKQPGK